MAALRKSTDERLEALRQREEKLRAQMTALETRKKAEDRKRETRRAFVVGAAVLARADADPAFRDTLRGALQATVMRDTDKAMVADLLGLELPASTLAESPPETEAA